MKTTQGIGVLSGKTGIFQVLRVCGNVHSIKTVIAGCFRQVQTEASYAEETFGEFRKALCELCWKRVLAELVFGMGC